MLGVQSALAIGNGIVIATSGCGALPMLENLSKSPRTFLG